MSTNTIQIGNKGECIRCGCTAKEWIEFSSKYKSSRIDVCADCFEEYRKTFMELTQSCTKD